MDTPSSSRPFRSTIRSCRRYFIFQSGNVLLAGMALMAGSCLAKDAEPVVPAFKFAEALPVVTAMAKREGIAFDKIDAAADREDLRPGDGITALVSLTDGEELSQWLVQMTCVELNEKEREQPVSKEMRIYTSTGTEIVFRKTRAAISMRVLGPYKKVKDFHDPEQLRTSLKAAADVNARATVNTDSLGLGFDRACESVLIVREALNKNPALRDFDWKVRDKPFRAEAAKEAKKKANMIGLTPERERAFVGTMPALIEFWRVASHTPGLQEIVKGVADLPWWSIIMKGGEANPPFLSS
jgi:hypothetical protein